MAFYTDLASIIDLNWVQDYVLKRALIRCPLHVKELADGSAKE
jgi:hypothetical protein